MKVLVNGLQEMLDQLGAPDQRECRKTVAEGTLRAKTVSKPGSWTPLST